jgi:mRNA interferase MazF
VSRNLANTYAPVVVCCPLTTKLKKYKGNPIRIPNKLNGIAKTSEVMVIYIRSVAKSRLTKYIRKVSVAFLDLAKQTIQELLHF